MKHNFFDWSKELGCISTYRTYEDEDLQRVPRFLLFFNIVRRFVLGLNLTFCTCYLEFEVSIIMIRFFMSIKFNRVAWDPEYRKSLTTQNEEVTNG